MNFETTEDKNNRKFTQDFGKSLIFHKRFLLLYSLNNFLIFFLFYLEQDNERHLFHFNKTYTITVVIAGRSSHRHLQGPKRQVPNMALPVSQFHPHGHMVAVSRRRDRANHQRNSLERVRHPPRSTKPEMGGKTP